MNVKLDEVKILDLKKVASVFHMTMTDAINVALDSYLSRMKSDPFYRLTSNVENETEEEGMEIFGAIDSMTDDDMSISSSRKFTVWPGYDE